jgi:transcriptional regulator with XRE-family HTH domain
LGGKIPRNIKEKVIRQWLQGWTRERIARENDIGAGTVTAIIKEAREQKEYHDIDLLRHVAIVLNEERLELAQLGFAVRLKRIMEENVINESQIEPIIIDFATYCFKHNLAFDKLIDCGYKALNLADKLGILVEKIPEYIVQATKGIQALDVKRHEKIRQTELIQEDYDTIVAEREKYGNEEQLIKRNKEIERELNECEARCRRFEEQFDNERRYGIAIDERRAEFARLYSLCHEELEKLKKSIK